MTVEIPLTEPSIFVDKHVRGINKSSWDTINHMRKLRRYSWKQFFDHIMSYKRDFELFLSRSPSVGLTTTKSLQTVSALLPKWCDNIAHNIQDILDNGDISCLVCRTRKDNKCQKIEKMKEMVFDKKNEYTLEEISEKCLLPLSMMNFMLRQIYTYSFVPIAGSHICIGCSDRTLISKPALIIGGGPSLKKHNHLELLKEHGFKGDIFVVGKEINNVLEHGIVPTYVGALDAEEFDTSFFDHDTVDRYSDKITGLFGITVHPTTHKRWKGKRYYFSGYIAESETPNISHIFHLMTQTTNISVSGNIGSCLYNMASYLGYNPIIMIGMDLSFPTFESMKEYYPHSTDEDWNRKLVVGDKEKPMYKRMWNPIWKKQYYVDSVFESYKISHLSWIKTLAEQGIKTINCTEGGALHSEHITSIKFEDFLKNQDKYFMEKND